MAIAGVRRPTIQTQTGDDANRQFPSDNCARATEREIIGQNVSGSDAALNEVKSADIADPTKLYEAGRKLSTLLVDRDALVPVAAAALIPLIAAGATQLPTKELIKVAKNLLL